MYSFGTLKNFRWINIHGSSCHVKGEVSSGQSQRLKHVRKRKERLALKRSMSMPMSFTLRTICSRHKNLITDSDSIPSQKPSKSIRKAKKIEPSSPIFFREAGSRLNSTPLCNRDGPPILDKLPALRETHANPLRHTRPVDLQGRKKLVQAQDPFFSVHVSF